MMCRKKKGNIFAVSLLNAFMKNTFIAICLVSLITACKTTVVDPDTLPKDIALKPVIDKDSIIPVTVIEDSTEIIAMEENIRELRNEIIQLSESKSCNDPTQWRISPLGAKPCGGPRSYIAYPKDLEKELLPKITRFNEASADYNRKRGLTSDCAIVPIPSGIRCEGGKAVLIQDGTSTSEAK